MITTKNRAGDLRRTCRVLLQLNPALGEVLITADGCIDNTVDVASRELSGVRLFVNELGEGSVVSRDRMIREARVLAARMCSFFILLVSVIYLLRDR